MKEVFLSASIACADFGHLAEQIRELEEAGVAFLHFDVVDGQFAPTFIMGPPVLASLRPYTKIPFEVHLACWNPEKYVEQFVQAGADYIAYHIEATKDAEHLAGIIRLAGAKPIVALRPETPPEAISDSLLAQVDMVLVLAVHPGFAGQRFIPETVEKIRALARRIGALGLNCPIEVDGNVNERTIPGVVEAGAQVLIGGTSGLFRKDRTLKESVRIMREVAYKGVQEGMPWCFLGSTCTTTRS
jgi:ribulose-phosphate 3-epimerase